MGREIRDWKERFWEKVNKLGPKQSHMKTRCWIWTGPPGSFGYGWFWLNGKTHNPHRVSWEIAHGHPGESHVLHQCDNPRCIRPAHLHLGMQADNMREASERGRSAIGARNGQHTHPERAARGERQHLAKLTAEQVEYIRSSNLSGPTMARMFNVTHQAIYYAKSKKTWKHV